MTQLLVTAALVGIGFAVWAAIPDASGVIHGCYKKSDGELRVIDPALESCQKSEVALDWNQTGLQGLQGPPGQDAVSLWAYVTVDFSQGGAPSLASSKGAVSVARTLSSDGAPLTGFFDVTFNRDVSQCAAVVSPEPASSYAAKAIILDRIFYQGPPFNQTNQFTVVIFDADESFIDEGFNIIVTC